MEELDFGTRVLNGFLSIMIVVLVLILGGVIIALLLAALGII